jgi:hypothetical protein
VAIDWSKGDLSHRLEVLQVDPLNLTDVRGRLAEPTGGELDLDYYGDTRMGGTVDEFGGSWDGSSALRLVHTVYDWTGDLLTETLFTGYVTRARSRNGTRTYELASTLHGLETNVTPGTFNVTAGTKALDVARHIFKVVSRPYRIDPGAGDYLFSGAVVYDAGSSYLSILFDLMDKSGNRISVDENGIVTVSRYVRPSMRTPDWEESTADARTCIIGAPDYSDGTMEMPERTIVHAEKDGATITVTSLAPAGTATRHSVRGWCIDDYHEESDLSPFTRDAAQALADRYLAVALEPDREMAHGLMYRPLREGMVEAMTDGGETRRWQVSSAALDLAAWTWDITFKGGWQ